MASRAELRRRAGESAPERPAVVWGRPVAAKAMTDAASPATSVHAATPTAEPTVAPAPVEDRATPPTTPELAATAVAAVAASIPVAAVVPTPVSASAEPAEAPAAAQPLSRRARRVATTAEHPVMPPVEPSLAAESPAPAERVVTDFRTPAPTGAATLPDAVLVPAEPFVLLEPVVEAAEPVPAAAAATQPFELLEPEPQLLAEVQPAPLAEPRVAASDIDEFEAAARLFSFTGETPIQPEAKPEDDRSSDTHVARRHSRPSNGAAFRRISAASFSVGVMGIVGLLTVGMTTPAEAVAAASGFELPVTVLAPGDTELEIDPSEIQAYVAPASVEEVSLERTETYATVTTAQLAAESGIKNFSSFFVNDPNSAIQWPFAVGVPISYGFGIRSGRMHEGVDFTPGAGSPIQAIADGVVRVATSSGGAYGVHVIIDHQIDGQLVSSHYAHMQYGSLQVSPGQHVTVGTILGRTGNTGRSYGAHTHFEILINGTTAIDPIPWLRQHAGG